MKLVKGGSVRISPGDEQVLNINKDLAKVIMSKFAKQKSHNLLGSGLYDDFKSGLGKVSEIAKPYAQQAFAKAVDYGTPAAQAAAKEIKQGEAIKTDKGCFSSYFTWGRTGPQY